MESFGCGVPAVGFQSGGIPEMIDHQENGYIDDLKNARDLSKGLLWVLDALEENDRLAQHARNKAEQCYSFQSVGRAHLDLYKQLIKHQADN